jgi:hypothetical protein
MNIAWSSKVSDEFCMKVCDICGDLGIDPDWLMAAMAFETGRTFSPRIFNQAGSGAVGLIQFMPKTARALGTTTEALASMSAVDQLDYVHKYFLPYRGRLHTLEDVYMAILWPRGIGLDLDDKLIGSDTPITYRQNCGLDIDKNGIITKREATEKVRRMLREGLEEPDVPIDTKG